MSNALTLSFQNHSIQQRADDGYLDATAMCQVVDRRLNNYLRNETTIAYLDALESDARIRASELIQVVKGGSPWEQGTWVHPKVAIHLAQWLSPEFAVWCTNVIFNYMNDKNTPTALPPIPKLTPAQRVEIQKQMFLRFPDGPGRAQAYIALKEHFGVARYYEIEESRFDEAMDFLEQGRPIMSELEFAKLQRDELVKALKELDKNSTASRRIILEAWDRIAWDKRFYPEHRREWQSNREAAA